jgi:hypothetical protein
MTMLTHASSTPDLAQRESDLPRSVNPQRVMKAVVGTAPSPT